MSPGHLERLIVDRLRADHFGGLRDVTLDLGGDGGLVVIHGPNESGKTTLATLLSWLLVGPTGTNAESLRFGRPDARIGGSLHGRLGGDELRIDATYRLPKRGLPNTGSTTMTLGGSPMTLGEWHTRLGGIDASVFTATYRMRGTTLHDGDEVLAEIARAALAGLAGSRHVHEVGEQLDQRVRELVSSRAADADSWSRLMSLVSAEEDAVRRIGGRAAEYRAAADRQVALEGLIGAARREITTLSTMATSLDVLRSVAEERHLADQLTDRIDRLGEIPEEWLAVIDDVDGLDAAARRLAGVTDEITELDTALLRMAASLGLTGPIDGYRVTHQVVTNVKVGLSELEAAQRRLAEAEQERARVVGLRLEADERARAARAACPELGGGTPDTAMPTDTPLGTDRSPADADLTEVRAAIQEWSIAERAATAAGAAVSGQRRRLEQAEADQRVAHAAWARFDTGSTAQHWRITPGTTDRRLARRPVWLVPAIAALAAGSAVLLLPRWAAVAITAGAGALVAVVMLRGSMSIGARAAASATTTSSEGLADIGAAAAAVIAADAAVDTELRDLGRLEADLGRVRRAVDEQRGRVDEACGVLGVTALGSAEATEQLVDRVLRTIDADANALVARSAERSAVERVERADAAVADRLAHLQALLHEAGLPSTLKWADAAHQIDALRDLTELHAERQIADEARQRARSEVETRLGPLGDTVDRHRLELIVVDAHRWRELRDEQRRLDAERSEAMRAIETRLRHDDGARQLADADLTDTALRARRAQVTAELETVQQQLESLLDERGQLTEQLARLAEHDTLTAARLRIGELHEQADARLRDGAVHLVARVLLARTATERRRSHQPALVARASELLRSVAPRWQRLLLDPDEHGSADVSLLDTAGNELPLQHGSTGARALTQLALRLATAELDAERRGLRVPIVADDPFVHLDDDRAAAVMPLLERAADDGHQVIVFTCHERTASAARAHGARIIAIG